MRWVVQELTREKWKQQPWLGTYIGLQVYVRAVGRIEVGTFCFACFTRTQTMHASRLARPGHVHRMCLSFIGRPVMKIQRRSVFLFLDLSRFSSIWLVFSSHGIFVCFFSSHVIFVWICEQNVHDSGFRPFLSSVTNRQNHYPTERMD